MNSIMRACLSAAALSILVGAASAASDVDATKLFRNSDESNSYFQHSYGYAVFPTIGKGGLGIGAAHGSGHVYEGGRLIGAVTMNQLSIGFQAGGKAYSEIIFFENKAALDSFTSGNFEFSGDVGAIVITASAAASVGTTGENASASTQKRNAETQGGYNHGMAVFTIAKGGLMYNATVAGQKFTYEPLNGRKVAQRD
jgi:lipid-binding SYLF domain-containing protein